MKVEAIDVEESNIVHVSCLFALFPMCHVSAFEYMKELWFHANVLR